MKYCYVYLHRSKYKTKKFSLYLVKVENLLNKSEGEFEERFGEFHAQYRIIQEITKIILNRKYHTLI